MVPTNCGVKVPEYQLAIRFQNRIFHALVQFPNRIATRCGEP